MPTREEIEKALGEIPPVEYPKELYIPRKAEFVTMVRKYKRKKPGCPFAILIFCLAPMIIGAIVQLIVTIF